MTSSIAEQIRADMIAAMKAKEKERVSVLRMLLAMLKDAAIEHRGEELSDAAVIQLLMGYAKKREETLTQVQQAGREDLAQKESTELAIVREYLPAPLTDGELLQLVTTVIAETKAASMKDMGRVMKLCQERAAGRASGTRLSSVVKQKLSG